MQRPMAQPASQPGNAATQAKPSFLAQAAKAFSQLALTFYVLLLAVGLMAPMVPTPYLGILMAILAVVPLALGPARYRIAGVVALLIAGGFYVSAKSQPQRPGAVAPQKSPAGAAPPPAAPEKTAR